MLRASQRILAARSLGHRAFGSSLNPRDGKSDRPAFNLDNLLGRLDAINKQAAASRGAAAKKAPAKNTSAASKSQGAKRAPVKARDSKPAAGAAESRPRPRDESGPSAAAAARERRSDTRPPRTQPQAQAQAQSRPRQPRVRQPGSDQSSETASAAFGISENAGSRALGDRPAFASDMPRMPLFANSDGEAAAERPASFSPRRRAAPGTKHRFVPQKQGSEYKPRTTPGTKTAPRGVRRLMRTKQRSEGEGRRAGSRSQDSQGAVSLQPVMAPAQAKELIMNKVGTSNNRIEISEYSVEALAKYLPRTALAYNSTVWRTVRATEVAQPRFAGQLQNDYLVHSNQDFGHALNSNPSYDLEQKELIAKAASGKITPAQLRKMISA